MKKVLARLSTPRRLKYASVYFKKSKIAVSKVNIVKLKTFRIQTSKLLGNRRKAYVLDVICNRSHFGKVQEEVLGQCTVGRVFQHPGQNNVFKLVSTNFLR